MSGNDELALQITGKKVVENVSIVGAIEAAADGKLGDEETYKLAMWLDEEYRRRKELDGSSHGVILSHPGGMVGADTIPNALEAMKKKLEIPPGMQVVGGTLAEEDPGRYSFSFVGLSPAEDAAPAENGGSIWTAPAASSEDAEHPLEAGVRAYEEAVRMHFDNPMSMHDPTLDRKVLLPIEIREWDARVYPSPGDRVLYINPGSLDGRFPPKVSPAIVIGPGNEPETVQLFVMTSAPGTYFNNNVQFGARPGCWIWPV